MRLSIIIPVFYGEEIFEKCLETLYPGTEPKLGKDWEILVLNNGFKPGRWRELEEIYPKIKFYGDGSENLGFAKGNNLLLEKTKGDYVLMLNQDVFIKPKVVEALLKFLDNNPDYACVAPQLRYGNNTIQESCRRFPTGLWFLLTDLFLKGKRYRHFYSLEKSQEVDQPLASCLLWRGKALRDLKGFDVHPHFFLYFNDVDLSYRLHRAGSKTYFLASVYAVHLHGGSASLLPENERIFHLYKGLGRFWYKTGSPYFWGYFKAFLGACIIGLGKIFSSK